LQYTNEFNVQVVRIVFESIKPTESRKVAGRRLATKVNVKEVALYNWFKIATPVAGKASTRLMQPGSPDDVHAQSTLLREENRGLTRANEILKAVSTFLRAELDRQSRE
jgi:transposase-like protein